MKKTLSILLALCMLLSLAVAVHAEHLDGEEGWKVVYTSEGRLVPNYKASGYSDPLSELQPGDDITLTIALINENDDTADFYISNRVIKSMEESTGASGGAYTYRLVYNGPDGEVVLYSSDTVGGDGSEGLKDATNALKDDMHFLGTQAKGQQGIVTLSVSLDGETQGNSYQNALADLEMSFAVAPEDTDEPVKTGDDAALFPLYVALFVSGGLLLALVIVLIVKQRKAGKEKAR